MTAWNIINLLFVFFSAYLAYQCFEAGSTLLGWLNLFASAVNAAALLAKV